MKSQAIRCEGRAEEELQVLIASDPDSGLPASDEKRISYIFIYNFVLFSGFWIVFIFTSFNPVYPGCTCIEVTVEGEYLALSKVPVSAEIYTGTDRIQICRSIIDIRGSLSDKNRKRTFLVNSDASGKFRTGCE